MMVEQERESHKNFRAKARVHANVAVAKYWGKRDESLNLPLFDSVAFNVDGLITETQAHWHNDDTRDALIINGWQVPAQSMGRVERILDKIRDIKGWDKRCTLQSRNNFPLASGLASSASGSAAAAAAAAAAAGIRVGGAEHPRRMDALACRPFTRWIRLFCRIFRPCRLLEPPCIRHSSHGFTKKCF